jgi:hypothetical protein
MPTHRRFIIPFTSSKSRSVAMRPVKIGNGPQRLTLGEQHIDLAVAGQ